MAPGWHGSGRCQTAHSLLGGQAIVCCAAAAAAVLFLCVSLPLCVSSSETLDGLNVKLQVKAHQSHQVSRRFLMKEGFHPASLARNLARVLPKVSCMSARLDLKPNPEPGDFQGRGGFPVWGQNLPGKAVAHFHASCAPAWAHTFFFPPRNSHLFCDIWKPGSIPRRVFIAVVFKHWQPLSLHFKFLRSLRRSGVNTLV